ncbi:MAG: alcohol dehydrogenase catalytic domain-containing protein [Defluviitaleaceae bacterium]|nr:alcohol dehydrogenase catalytic domain-containing protein [Defluviitaleaceae bacterium]
MLAYVVNAPYDGNLCERETPRIAADEVLVRVRAASVCHSDLDIIEGRRVHSLTLPVILGHEFAGEIIETGADIKDLKIGMAVGCECIIWCGRCRACLAGDTSRCENFNELGTMRDGGFAEYAAVPSHMVHRLRGLPADEASNLEPAGNGFHAAEACGIREGDAVAVIGPGPIGLYAMQCAALYKPDKLIMAGTRKNRLETAKLLGATHTVNVSETDAYKSIIDITEGKGADRVIQCATTPEANALAVKILGSNSVLAMEGYGGGTLNMAFNDFLQKPVSILGVTGVSHRHFKETLAAAESGKIKIAPVITHRFPLCKIEEAFKLMKDKNANAIKIVINP